MSDIAGAILIVDDDAEMRSLISDLLSHEWIDQAVDVDDVQDMDIRRGDEWEFQKHVGRPTCMFRFIHSQENVHR